MSASQENLFTYSFIQKCLLGAGHLFNLEEETATHTQILAWEIPWTEEPGGLQSMTSPHPPQHTHTVLVTGAIMVSKKRDGISLKIFFALQEC